MELQDLKERILSLSPKDRDNLFSSISNEFSGSLEDQSISRRDLLNNKQGECPHCSHKKYVRFGIDKGSQRYKCKSCMRSFTEYTGLGWLGCVDEIRWRVI